MIQTLTNLFRQPVADPVRPGDGEIAGTGIELRHEISRLFKRSLAIREVDCGSDNAAEIEIANLSAPHYDVERFGITFVASPRHADALMVTGAVTRAMAPALLRTYEATPEPRIVIAVGDDACDGGVFRGSYAVLGGVGEVIPVDLKIPGNPPRPEEILSALLSLLRNREGEER